MVKNQLEKHFSLTLKSGGWFFMKLHNNLLAHQTTPADYILSYRKNLYLIECKQVTCTDKLNRLVFKRLKQMRDLITFQSMEEHHKAYFLIAFKEKFWANSDLYFIPAVTLKKYIDSTTKKSINRTEIKVFFKNYKFRHDIFWKKLEASFYEEAIEKCA